MSRHREVDLRFPRQLGDRDLCRDVPCKCSEQSTHAKRIHTHPHSRDVDPGDVIQVAAEVLGRRALRCVDQCGPPATDDEGCIVLDRGATERGHLSTVENVAQAHVPRALAALRQRHRPQPQPPKPASPAVSCAFVCRRGGTGENELTGPAALVNLVTHGIPECGRQLPLIDQPRGLTGKYRAG